MDHFLYRPLGDPMLLVSKGGEPLAALHFKGDGGALSTIYPRGTKEEPGYLGAVQQFHGLVDQGDRKIQLTLTNLCQRDDISFNLFLDGGGSSRVNKVNVLPPLTSWDCKQDATNGLRALMIHGETVVDDKGVSQKLSVGDNESSAVKKAAGLVFRVSVQPEGHSDATELSAQQRAFEGCRWVSSSDMQYVRLSVWKPRDRGGFSRVLGWTTATAMTGTSRRTKECR
jgi:hypothetical protein